MKYTRVIFVISFLLSTMNSVPENPPSPKSEVSSNKKKDRKSKEAFSTY